MFLAAVHVGTVKRNYHRISVMELAMGDRRRLKIRDLSSVFLNFHTGCDKKKGQKSTPPDPLMRPICQPSLCFTLILMPLVLLLSLSHSHHVCLITSRAEYNRTFQVVIHP